MLLAQSKKRARITNLIFSETHYININLVLFQLFGYSDHVFFVCINWRSYKYNNAPSVIFALPVLQNLQNSKSIGNNSLKILCNTTRTRSAILSPETNLSVPAGCTAWSFASIFPESVVKDVRTSRPPRVKSPTFDSGFDLQFHKRYRNDQACNNGEEYLSFD